MLLCCCLLLLHLLHATASAACYCMVYGGGIIWGTYVRAYLQWKQCVADVGEADSRHERKMKSESDRCARWYHVVRNCDWLMCLVIKRNYKPAALCKIWDWFEHLTLNRLLFCLNSQKTVPWIEDAVLCYCCMHNLLFTLRKHPIPSQYVAFVNLEYGVRVRVRVTGLQG